MRPILLMEIKKAYKNKLFLLSMLTASLIALYAAVFSIISYHKYVNADSASAALTGYALNPELPRYYIVYKLDRCRSYFSRCFAVLFVIAAYCFFGLRMVVLL